VAGKLELQSSGASSNATGFRLLAAGSGSRRRHSHRHVNVSAGAGKLLSAAFLLPPTLLLPTVCFGSRFDAS